MSTPEPKDDKKAEDIITLKNRDELLAFLKSSNKPYITMSDNTLIKSFTADISELDIEKDANGADSATFTAVLSSDLADSAGDIVLQDGIDFTRYDGGMLPLLNSHNSEEIAGTIDKVWKTTAMFKGEKVKVTKVTATLNDTEHGKYWMAVKKSGLPMRLSLGALVKEAELIKNKKDQVTGILYKKVEAIEGSVVAVPANPVASQVSKDINIEDYEMTKEELANLTSTLVEMNKKLDKLAELNESFTKSLEVSEDRLDEIASKMTSNPTLAKELPAKDAESKKQADEIFAKKVNEIVEQLRNIKKS